MQFKKTSINNNNNNNKINQTMYVEIKQRLID